MTKSTSRRADGKRPARSGKPKKPDPNYPLHAHNLGYWVKKVRGQLHRFGRWGHIKNGKMERLPGDAGAQAALEAWLDQKDELLAGRVPIAKGDGQGTVRDVCNRFLTKKNELLHQAAPEISYRSFLDYKQTAERMVKVFGPNRLVSDLSPDDFQRLRADLAKTCGPVRLGNEVQRVRSIFKAAFVNEWISQPPRFGEFKKPSRKTLRVAKATSGPKLFEAAEIRRMLDKASPPMKAFILLAINAGFGNSDCGRITWRDEQGNEVLDLDKAWVTYPRRKTGTHRRAKLWPETIEAIQEAVADQPAKPKDEADKDLVFLTRCGAPWGKDHADNPVCKEFAKLLDELKLHRRGLGFYGLRHTYRTVADECLDFPAINLTMGHSDTSIAGHYRECIDDKRLEAISRHVHAWLFKPEPPEVPGRIYGGGR